MFSSPLRRGVLYKSHLAVLYRSPLAVHYRSPLSVLYRSPLAVLYRSPLAVLYRSPLAVLYRSPLAVLNRSPLAVLEGDGFGYFNSRRKVSGPFEAGDIFIRELLQTLPAPLQSINLYQTQSTNHQRASSDTSRAAPIHQPIPDTLY